MNTIKNYLTTVSLALATVAITALLGFQVATSLSPPVVYGRPRPSSNVIEMLMARSRMPVTLERAFPHIEQGGTGGGRKRAGGRLVYRSMTQAEAILIWDRLG